MRETFLFEYIHQETILYRLNPAFKFLLLIAVCTASALLPPLHVSVLFFLMLLLLPFSGRAARMQLKAMWKLYIFIAVSGVVKGLTAGSVVEGTAFSCRMAVMMFSGVYFYSSTKITAFRSALHKLAGIGNLLRKNHTVDLIVMTTAFLPVIFKTMNELKQARYSRCFGPPKINFHSILRSIRLTTIPLLTDMFIKTDLMADAWYSRCFGYEGTSIEANSP